MKSFNEIMAKVAGKLPPELAVNAARVKQVQDPSRPGAETPPKSSLKMVAKMQPNKPQPKTASVSDDLDRGFVSWMEKKAGEDVVKVASDDEDDDEESECSMDHSKLKPGTKCKKCGEMCKESSVKEALSRGFIDTMISGKKIIDKGGRTASQRLMRASDRGQSAFSRRVGADAPKRMTNSALELQSQADNQLDNIGRGIGRDIAAGRSKYASDLEKYRDIMMKSAPEKVEPAVLKLLKRRGAIGGAKGALLGSALTAGAGALYIKGRKDQRAKTAGVVENQENLDLLELIKKRMAAGSAMVGDV